MLDELYREKDDVKASRGSAVWEVPDGGCRGRERGDGL